MRVLLLEQWSGGHHTNYLECLAPKFSELAAELIVAVCPSFYESSGFERVRAAVRGRANVRLDPCLPEVDARLPLRERLKPLANVRRAIARFRPDYTFLPSGDAQTIALGLTRWVSCGALSPRARSEAIVHYGYGPGPLPAKAAVRRAIYNLAFRSSSWDRLNFVNFLLYESFAPRARRGRIALLPDPVPAPSAAGLTQARQRLGLPEEGRLIGFVGVMDRRKAIPELLQAFRQAPLAASDRLLLAGRLTADVAGLVAREYGGLVRQGRLMLLDRWLSDEELLLGYRACDVVCLPYYEFASLSSLMLKAIAARRQVLVHDFGWMRAVARRFGAASVCDISNPASFSAAIARSLDESASYRFTPAMQALLEFHAPENFAEHAVATLRALTARPAPLPPLPWDAVLARLEPERRALS